MFLERLLGLPAEYTSTVLKLLIVAVVRLGGRSPSPSQKVLQLVHVCLLVSQFLLLLLLVVRGGSVVFLLFLVFVFLLALFLLLEKKQKKGARGGHNSRQQHYTGSYSVNSPDSTSLLFFFFFFLSLEECLPSFSEPKQTKKWFKSKKANTFHYMLVMV